MRTGYGLELLQAQRLNLTPEMRQAITVLQMNAAELRAFIISQAEENLLIDLDEDDSQDDLSGESKTPDDELPPDDGEASLDFADSVIDLSRDPASQKDLQLEFTGSRNGTSLKEHLLSQLGLLPLSEGEFLAARTIVESLDDNGYLTCATHEIAALCGRPASTVTSMLKVVQSLDPPGVGAADLRECLSIQARARGLGAFVERLIEAHLEDLAAARYKKIAKEERVTLSKVLSGRDAILGLDPKPGSKFSDAPVTYVFPEITIRKVEGNIEVEFNDRWMPRVRLNPFYRDLARRGDKEVRSYLMSEMKRAKALVRCIEQRRTTILKVMKAVAARQEAFLDRGPGHLEPLTLREISEQVGVHESTVSRAIANKYVDTPYGVFPCRAFFTSKVAAEDTVRSRDTVKASILEIVRSEDRRNPLTDEAICRELEKRGMRVARRTVSKYRGELGIMPKDKRRGL